MPLFLFPALATGLLLFFSSGTGRATDPNIIVFLADDMGMGDTSVYQDWTGNKDDRQLHTPNMERIANMGVRFMDAHSPHSRCSTSRYALLTGRYCWRSSLKYWVLFGVQCDPLIEKPRPTIASFLRRNGYRTGMVGKMAPRDRIPPRGRLPLQGLGRCRSHQAPRRWANRPWL